MRQLRRIMPLVVFSMLLGPGAALAQHHGLENVALGRPVAAAAGIGTFRGGPQNVTDGKGDTDWYSFWVQEYTVDLGTEVPVGKIVAYVGQAQKVAISSSLDGVTFALQHAFNSTDAGHSNWIGGMVYSPLTFEANGAYSARYLRYRSENVGCGCYQGTYEFAVYPWVSTPPPVLSGSNLSPGSTATNATPFTSATGFPPSSVTDGDMATAWKGSWTTWHTGMAGQRLGTITGRAQIDLGAEVLVYGAIVRRPSGGGAQGIALALYDWADQEIWWSGDGDPAIVSSPLAGLGSVDFVLPSPVRARYVRVYQVNSLVHSGSELPALAEVEIYGDASYPDTTAPEVNVPPDIVAEATGPDGAAVHFWVTAVDDVDGERPVACTPASGSTFPLGPTTVECSASDTSANSGSASFSVTVVDTTSPTLTLPGDLRSEATGPAGAVVSFVATAADLVAGPVLVSCAPGSGAVFALGTTSVACSARDTGGNTAGGSFSVTVVDTTPPTLTLPASLTVQATETSGTAVSFSATAVDLVSGSVPVTCVPASGATFSIGSTTVNCEAVDAALITAAGAFAVIVTPPPDNTGAALSRLLVLVNGVGPGQGLGAKVRAVQTALARGDIAAACGSLSALANETRAQSGKKLTEAQAVAILAQVNQMRSALGCT